MKYLYRMGKYQGMYEKLVEMFVPSSGYAEDRVGELLRAVNNLYFYVIWLNPAPLSAYEVSYFKALIMEHFDDQETRGKLYDLLYTSHGTVQERQDVWDWLVDITVEDACLLKHITILPVV